MKKILTAIVLFVFVALPMSVMAMQTITDNELSAVTGQAGVSINVDFTTNLQIGTVAWGDSDGLGAGTAAGFVGVESLNLTIHMSGRHDGQFANTATSMGYLLNTPIMIDVATVPTQGTIVRIGLPTSHIIVSSLDTNIFVSGANGTGPASTTATQLGHIYMSGVVITLGQNTTAAPTVYDAGYVTIGAAGAGNTGVNIGFNIKIESIAIDTLSYGNTTSILSNAGSGTIPAFATSEGYIGVTDLRLGKVTIAGGVAIGVGTLDGAALGASAFGTQTMVNIVIADNTTIAIPDAITGKVKLGTDKTLATGAELGNFYIGGVTATFVANTTAYGNEVVAPHSLVQIWAH